MTRKTCVFGGTFYPPHYGHLEAVKWLNHQGYRVIVVPSACHEHKPGSSATYPDRKIMAQLAFGNVVHCIEDCIDPNDPRRALLVLQEVHELIGGTATDISFAIGFDIDPRTWTGYDEIIQQGFSFVRVPSLYVDGSLALQKLSSTAIREMLEAGEDCSDYVPAPVLRYWETIKGL